MDNNKFGNIIALCAFWVVVAEGYTSKELKGLFLFIAIVTGLVLTVIAIGVDYVQNTIKEVFELIRKAFHDAFIIIIIGIDTFQIFLFVIKRFFPQQADYIINSEGFSLSVNHCIVILVMFVAICAIYNWRYYNWVSCELMFLSFIIPTVHDWLVNNNTASVPFNQVYLAIIIVLCIWYILKSRKRSKVGSIIEEFVLSSVTISSTVGYIQRVVHYRNISYLRLFIMVYVIECVVYGVRRWLIDKND